MASNKQGKGKVSLTEELESIRDSLAVPTQIPLLKDVVNHKEKTVPNKKPSVSQPSGQSGSKKRVINTPLPTKPSALHSDAASLKKIRAASDRLIEELTQEYTRKMSTLIRNELGSQLDKMLRGSKSPRGKAD